MPFYRVKCVKDSTRNDSELWTRADFQVWYFDGEQRRLAPDQGRDWAVSRDVFDRFRSRTYNRTSPPPPPPPPPAPPRRGCARLNPLLHLRCVRVKKKRFSRRFRRLASFFYVPETSWLCSYWRSVAL
ncbi:hypothetical protein NPIL_292051 [Nephila pilipes]|uniref:Uncharacterized protein n=1 Tax=Nephila pilipes TaxID=299642 RepID=A0A8X6J7Y9_NEPPI|nr:hypothetical protein NPIL_292051 [Nephila pilipes]